jgi:uncharacterized protein (TIGR03435 family)
MKSTLKWLLPGSMLAVSAFAQPAPAIDVATVKPSHAAGRGISNSFNPGRFTYTNVALKALIETVWRVRDYQIVDAPGWLGSETWDLTVTTTGPTGMDRKMELLKGLLAERFQLQFHEESRELPVFWLIMVKNGPKFSQPADVDKPGLRIGTGLIEARKWDVSTLTSLLSAELNVPVLDKTGLSGIYNFRLEWSPSETGFGFDYADPAMGPPPADPSKPSVFTAIQDQLGLRLQPSRGPVRVLVIDRVERPSAN